MRSCGVVVIAQFSLQLLKPSRRVLRVSVAAMAAMASRSKKLQILMSHPTPTTTNLTVICFSQIRGKPISQEPHGEDLCFGEKHFAVEPKLSRSGRCKEDKNTLVAHSGPVFLLSFTIPTPDVFDV